MIGKQAYNLHLSLNAPMPCALQFQLGLVIELGRSLATVAPNFGQYGYRLLTVAPRRRVFDERQA
jgi:hypothetical protein